MNPAPRSILGLLLTTSLLSVSACAPRPDTITARYVSPAAYRTWQCEDMLEELSRLESEKARLFGLQQENADAGAGVAVVGTGVSTGMIVAGAVLAVPTFGWSLLLIPAGLATGGGTAASIASLTTDRREEVSRILGEIEAINISQRTKSCPIQSVSPAQAPVGANLNNAVVPVAVPRSSQASASVSLPPRQTGPSSQHGQTPICPPAGTRWATSNWSVVSGGADPASPNTCIRTTGRGVNHRLIYNFFAAGNASDESIVQGMASLFPLALGRSADFRYVGTGGGGVQYQYQNSIYITNQEIIPVGSEQRDTWVLRRVQQRLGDNYGRVEENYWIDKESGVWLRRVVVDVQGTSVNPNFSASGYTVTSLTRSP